MLNLFIVIVGILGFLSNCSTAAAAESPPNNPICFTCQSITLHETNSSTSYSVTIEQEFIPDVFDVPALKWNGSKSHLGCPVGEWIAYTGPNYTGESTTIIQAVVGGACTYYNERSFRFVGHPKDVRLSSLNLYEGRGFIGKVRLYDAAEPNLTASFQSFIITGSVAWTFYLQPNYQGESFCRNTTAEWTDTHVRDIGSLGLRPGDVRSFQAGCAPDWPFTATTPATAVPSIASTISSGIWFTVIAMVLYTYRLVISSYPIN